MVCNVISKANRIKLVIDKANLHRILVYDSKTESEGTFTLSVHHFDFNHGQGYSQRQ